MQSNAGKRSAADLLAIGFGASVCMWGLCYLLRMPGAAVPAWLLLFAALGVALLAGFVTGRTTGRGWRGGLYVGLIAGGFNLLVISSLVSGHKPNEVIPSALWWMPGSLGVTAALTTFGAMIGARGAKTPPAPSAMWTARFAAVACGATLLLISAGGVVTGHDAGLAVPDWPNSFGYGMFLYPLARMTGGIYYEHAHRLFGALVGFATLVLAIHLSWAEPRRWVKLLVWLAGIVCLTQAVLGGLRVTGRITLSDAREAMAPNLALAMVHGVLAQVFLTMLVALRIVLGRTWRSAAARVELAAAGTDRVLFPLLALGVFAQIVLGALLRHIDWGLELHIGLALMVIGLALAVGLRAGAYYSAQGTLPRLGVLLIVAVLLQFTLGIAALVVTRFLTDQRIVKGVEVAITTAHQTLGAVLLAATVALWLLQQRLTAPVLPERGVPART